MRLHLDESAQRQVALGKQLYVEKQACAASGQSWRAYIRETYPFTRERADELIRIGTGLVTVADARENKKQRTRRYRQRSGNPAATEKALLRIERARALCALVERRVQQVPHPTQELTAGLQAVQEMLATCRALLEKL